MPQNQSTEVRLKGHPRATFTMLSDLLGGSGGPWVASSRELICSSVERASLALDYFDRKREFSHLVYTEQANSPKSLCG